MSLSFNYLTPERQHILLTTYYTLNDVSLNMAHNFSLDVHRGIRINQITRHS